MSRWYRAYEDTTKDDKLAEAAIIAETSRSVVIATWHALLESAASAQAGGVYETTSRRVAAVLGEPVAAIEAVFAAFQEIGLIADGKIAAWQKRQFESDTSTERSRKHREAKRNADATLQQRDATPPDTDTDTDTEQKLSLRSSHARADKPAPMFEAFWAAYPQKIGKTAAKAAFDKAVKREPSLTIESLLQAIDAYRRGKPPDREWCHPTTWLNQGRWNDDWTEEQKNADRNHHRQGQPASRARSGPDTYLAAIRAEAEQLDDRGFPDRRDPGADFGDGCTLDLRAN